VICASATTPVSIQLLPGDTLTSIALRYHTSVAAIAILYPANQLEERLNKLKMLREELEALTAGKAHSVLPSPPPTPLPPTPCPATSLSCLMKKLQAKLSALETKKAPAPTPAPATAPGRLGFLTPSLVAPPSLRPTERPTIQEFETIHVFEAFSPSLKATLYLEGIDQDEFASMKSNFIEALLRLLCPSAQPGPVCTKRRTLVGVAIPPRCSCQPQSR
jgi:hypothetical protein